MTRGYGDFHSHLVPGVDDGCRTLDESLHAVERMTAAGITKVVTTPHFRASMASAGDPWGYMRRLDDRWKKLRGAVREHYPQLDFRRGLEVRMDAERADLSDPRIRLGGTRFVLVEWPRFREPPRACEMLARLVDADLVPIVAHPERYHGIDRELEDVRAWRRAGAFIQVNYGSLAGQNGRRVKKRGFSMLREGLVDYLCTDFHGRVHYTLYLGAGVDEVLRRGGDGQLDLLARVNPGRLFDGEPPLPVPPLVVKEPEAQLLEGLLDD